MIMSSAPIGPTLPEAPPRTSCSGSRFFNLRGIQWRIDLGILPCSPASVNDLRRAAADSRRRYASLRRCLLVDPHLSKDGNRSSHGVMDDPLSQSPDSKWGQFFRNAEVEKMVDQDLLRLYPEEGSYFQTNACQSKLRRVLLLWCLAHPEHGYRQGMHELLAPLLYVLHVDVQHLFQVQRLHEDHFKDESDGMPFEETDLLSRKTTIWKEEIEKNNSFQGIAAKGTSFVELDPDTKDIILLTDAYGSEGELGMVISNKFMEHDAFSMFDSLMNGAGGVVSLAEFFSPSPSISSSTGLPPVIEASSALYHLLSIVDSSLHSHLVELGVEPQYFAMRWLRILFEREFSLEDLLIIWDEIFSSPDSINLPGIEDGAEFYFRVLCSPRGAFITAMAVSMLLHLRSSILATELATSCLQKLLKFPYNINVKRLIEKAKSLQTLVLDTNMNKPLISRVSPISSMTSSNLLPESYWEEKWRVIHKADELHKGHSKGLISGKMINGLFQDVERDACSCVRHRLVDVMFPESNSETNFGEFRCNEFHNVLGNEESLPMEGEMGVGNNYSREPADKLITKGAPNSGEEICLGAGNFLSPVCLAGISPLRNDSDKISTATTNSADHDYETGWVENLSTNSYNGGPRAGSPTVPKLGSGSDGKRARQAWDKLQRFWKLGRRFGEVTSEQRDKVSDDCRVISITLTSDGCCDSADDRERKEVGNKKVTGTLRKLGQSMHENIQVIESFFQQDQGQVGSLENSPNDIILGGKEQATVNAMAALKELRKISNVLTEM